MLEVKSSNMSKKICFFEPDEALAEKLIDYWLGHSLAECSICYYSDMDKWLVDYPSMEADLWILDRSLEPRLPPNLSGKILWWTERSEDTHAVFKYRSAAVLQHTILHVNLTVPGNQPLVNALVASDLGSHIPKDDRIPVLQSAHLGVEFQ